MNLIEKLRKIHLIFKSWWNHWNWKSQIFEIFLHKSEGHRKSYVWVGKFAKKITYNYFSWRIFEFKNLEKLQKISYELETFRFLAPFAQFILNSFLSWLLPYSRDFGNDSEFLLHLGKMVWLWKLKTNQGWEKPNPTKQFCGNSLSKTKFEKP